MFKNLKKIKTNENCLYSYSPYFPLLPLFPIPPIALISPIPKTLTFKAINPL